MQKNKLRKADHANHNKELPCQSWTGLYGYPKLPFFPQFIYCSFKSLSLNKLISVYNLSLFYRKEDLFSLTIPLVKQ